MSAEAVTVVLHHSRAEGTAKLVLWGIANHHSDAGAWPSIATLAKYAAVSERRVQQIIRELADLGEIYIDEQGGLGQGQYKTNRYHVLIQCPADCDGSLNHKTGVKSEVSGVKSGAVRGEIQSQSGVKPVSPELNKEPNKNINALFEEFWNAYPRKLDKAKAFRAFKSALSRTTFEDVMAGVVAYRNDPARNPDFTKYPATWLNADSWENAANPGPESEAADRARLRREKELAASREYLEQQRQQAEKATGPVYCEHGKNLALCAPCSKSLN
jgi:hypothetical protein